MELNKEKLKKNFETARKSNAPYVYVTIYAEGTIEAIVIPKASFDAKEEFYMRAYTDNLIHSMNKNVYIIGFSYGDAQELVNVI